MYVGFFFMEILSVSPEIRRSEMCWDATLCKDTKPSWDPSYPSVLQRAQMLNGNVPIAVGLTAYTRHIIPQEVNLNVANYYLYIVLYL